MIGMNQIFTALKSSKVATLVALAILIGYGVTELGDHPSLYANAKLPVDQAFPSDQDLVREEKRVIANIPVPLSRPEGLPEIEQPHQITVVSLESSLDNHSFDLSSIRDGLAVPRHFVDSIPADIQDIENVKRKKAVFLSITLPLILKVNEDIAVEREKLLGIIDKLKTQDHLTKSEKSWLKKLALKYRTSDGNFYELMLKVDTIPVSLALAQSIEESGWGTSRFARNGNALFGQRVWAEGHGLVPHERDSGKKYEVKSFDHLEQSIRSYALNLNRHNAYGDFRLVRAQLRTENVPLNGFKLASTLDSYSERGHEYVETLQALIQTNRLTDFDTVQLERGRLAQALSPVNN
nr:glucosaminidase domain-containing protein [Sneathiella limimaris]